MREATTSLARLRLGFLLSGKQTIEELSAAGAVLFNKTWNSSKTAVGKYVDLHVIVDEAINR